MASLNIVQNMSGRQRAMKLFYPLIMKLLKLFGMKSRALENKPGARPAQSLYKIRVVLNNGKEFPMSEWEGKKILIVNTASDCGFTPQYEGLQQLYEQFNGKLGVIGFPANDFKEQEKGSDTEIAQFCKLNYGVTFPLVKKSTVIKGPDQHPVFRWLSHKELNGWCNQQPEWNFSKYLVNEEGMLTNYFAASVSPLDPEVMKAICSGV